MLLSTQKKPMQGVETITLAVSVPVKKTVRFWAWVEVRVTLVLDKETVVSPPRLRSIVVKLPLRSVVPQVRHLSIVSWRTCSLC